LLSPQQALISMADDGFNRVAVQSLHSIPGEEFSALAATVRAFSDMPDGIEKISIGNPLLFTTQDLLTVSDALIANFPKERKKNEMILFMGHGTPHPANVYYPALAQVLCRKDPNIRIATVEGWPELADILPDLSAQESKTIYLMPFMSVAGDHARNDMAGDEPDSWKSILESQGLTVIPVLHGTAEFDEIVDIWIAHLQDALKTIM
ncbi:MAG: sirohydrochlorin cobaltochelatase, partial [Proteobacteria bacterium]|nr:sirohydrochlorin cobaltochelatase [Pseudomonadota bacterium]